MSAIFTLEVLTMSYVERWQTSSIKKALDTRRVVILAGARQSGKTTASKKEFVDAQTEYRTLDDKLLLQAAVDDPNDFVRRRNNGLMIIDEIQKAVDLLPAIKKAVDENNTKGQYLLTGSANIQSLPGVTESLAGRVRKITMRPLSQGEILASKPSFLGIIFSNRIDDLKIKKLEKDDFIEIALRGGYPETIELDAKDRFLWHQDYIEALLDRDLKDIVNIRRKQAMKDLLGIVAAWSTKFMDISAIGSGLSIKRPTLESYLNALELLYLVDKIEPWTKTDYERVNKQAKLIFNDSGLMSSILRWNMDDVRLNSDRLGKLIETHVGNELQKHADASNGEFYIFQYRDREKREIDFIIENNNGDLLGIEVKSNTVVGSAEFKHLKWFKENLVKDGKSFTGIVLYTGKELVSFGPGLWAIPVNALY